MQPVPVAILGGSGYAGLEVTRLVARHPQLTLRCVASDQWAGRTLGAQLGLGGAHADQRYLSLTEGERVASDTPLVLLATPAAGSLALAPRLLGAGVKVVDLSGAFRLRAADAYPLHYALTHSHPVLLAEAVYGLPELPGAEGLARARLVANPGCYATAVALALGPLVARRLILPDDLIVDAASGVTGAGRKATEELSFAEVEGDLRAYKVLSHQHTPEMAQTLAGIAGEPVSLTFTPHLLPLRRGILATAHARLRPGVTRVELAEAFQSLYRDRPFVHVLDSAEQVSLRRTVHTGRCDLGFTCDERRVVVVAALDNLLKGAASQAVQNLNLMSGWPETLGLDHLRDSPA